MDGHQPALCATDCVRYFSFITLRALFALAISAALSGCLLDEKEPIANDTSISPDLDEAPDTVAGDGETVDVFGTLTILYLDEFDDRRAQRQFFIEDKQSKKRWKLRFQDTPPGHLRSGMELRIRGNSKGKEIIVEANGAGSSPNTLSTETTEVGGDQKTLVMIGNFSDASVSCTADSVRDLVFTDPADQSVDDMYRETSHGALSLSGEVRGPYSLGQSRNACDFNAWADYLDDAASNEGVNLSAYSRRVYVMPRNGCSASGIGTVGGNPSRAWIFRCDIPDVYAHELGHNFGLHHAATPDSEYGDYTDVMGLARNHLRQVNAPHKEQMGWLPPSQILTVRQPGVYDIAPLELDAAAAIAPQVLKIPRPDTGEYYYLSYRRAIGFDANMNESLYLDRVSVHQHPGDGTATKTQLLALPADGESFVDNGNGVTATTLSHNDEYVTVDVSFDGAAPPPTCTPASPLVSLSPAVQTSVAGESLDYVVSVANQDSSACDSSSFALSFNLPAGWIGELTTGTLALGPGDTDSAMLTVRSGADSSNGDYGIAVTAADNTVAEHSATGNAIYAVASTCAPTAPGLTLSPGSQNGNPGASLDYTLMLISNDNSACDVSTYDLTIGALPTGWTYNLSETSVALPAGGSTTVLLAVTSVATTAPGSYSVPVAVIDDAEPVHDNSVAATYVVNDSASTIDTEPPSTPTGLSAKVVGKRIDLSWIAASDNVGVDGYYVYRDGIRIASTRQSGYSDRSVEVDITYTYTVAAFDASGNVSAETAPVSAKIEAKGGGRGKRSK